MILQNDGSRRVDCDSVSGRQKRFIIKHQSQNTRDQPETRSQQKLCCQNNIISNNGCRAQQRLINLTATSKIKDEQPKLPSDSSIQKNSVDPKPPFVYKVQNYEHINASKADGKLSNAIVINNGYYEYYPKDPNSNFTVKKIFQNDSKKLNENCIKENLNNSSQTINRDLHLSTVYNITEKKTDNYKNNNFENVFMGTIEKIKAFENDSSGNNSTSEKADLTDSTLKCFQQWFVKNEPAVSKLCTGNKQISTKTRPLKISEALQLHERENELNVAYKTYSKNNASKDRFFLSSEDNITKFENLKISEFHENFLVEKLEDSIKSGRNICTEDKKDCNDGAPSEVFSTDDRISEFLSRDDVSSKVAGVPKNSLSRADHDRFNSRYSFNDHQRFSISTKNLKKYDIQKSSSKNTASKIDLCIQKKKDAPAKNTSTYSKNCAYNCNKSRNLSSSDYSTGSNNNRFTGLTNKYNSVERKNPKAISTSSSENLLSSQQDLSFTTAKENLISEEADMVMRSFKGFKQSSGRNHSAESTMFTKDRQFIRKNENISSTCDLPSKSYNDKTFSDSCLPLKDHPKMKKPLNSKVMPSKASINELGRNRSNQFLSLTDFQHKQQQKVPNDSHGDSVLTSFTPAHKERAKISRLPSSKDLFKEYNTSHQHTLKYAKSFSDFSALMKSSQQYPAGKGTTQTNSCLAQQRLLSRKPLKT